MTAGTTTEYQASMSLYDTLVLSGIINGHCHYFEISAGGHVRGLYPGDKPYEQQLQGDNGVLDIFWRACQLFDGGPRLRRRPHAPGKQGEQA